VIEMVSIVCLVGATSRDGAMTSGGFKKLLGVSRRASFKLGPVNPAGSVDLIGLAGPVGPITLGMSRP